MVSAALVNRISVRTKLQHDQKLGCRFGIRTDSVEGRIRTDSGGFREVSTPETNPWCTEIWTN